jgi:hypothetical protein
MHVIEIFHQLRRFAYRLMAPVTSELPTMHSEPV